MSYPGGKGASGVVQQIINCIPPVEKIASIFGGNCALLRTIRAAKISFFIDTDEKAVEDFQTWCMVNNRRDIQCCNDNAFNALLSSSWQLSTLIYCDPPYFPPTLSSSRPTRNGQRYAHKFGVEAHEKLLSIITTLKCYVMISGYRSAMYDRALTEPAWYRKDFQAMTRGGVRTESLWMNYDPAQLTELHDYRFLGNTFREREAWKKRRSTIERKFNNLSTLEKRALREHLQNLV